MWYTTNHSLPPKHIGENTQKYIKNSYIKEGGSYILSDPVYECFIVVRVEQHLIYSKWRSLYFWDSLLEQTNKHSFVAWKLLKLFQLLFRVLWLLSYLDVYVFRIALLQQLISLIPANLLILDSTFVECKYVIHRYTLRESVIPALITWLISICWRLKPGDCIHWNVTKELNRGQLKSQCL